MFENGIINDLSKNEYDWMTHDIDGLEILRVLGLPTENELVDHVDAS